MKLPASIAGAAVGPLEQTVDARWLMAYTAALGDTAPEHFDTERDDGIVAHPLFPVCYEWPLAVELRARFGDDLAVRSVHATHDLVLHRLPRAGDRLATTAVVTAVEARPPGAYVVTRFETVDAHGAPVSVTEYGSLYRGVSCDGAPGPAAPPVEDAPAPPARAWAVDVPVASTLAHVYTECARIWNPIHTDRAVARAAGLPDIILHGTATLALAVSAILRREPPGAAREVTRIRCQFRAMVPLPSTITVQAAPSSAQPARTIGFEVRNAEGRAAITRGWLALDRAARD